VFSSHSSRDSLQAVAVTKWLREQEPGLVDEICLDLDPHTGIRQLRRLLPAAAQLLLLGATLFRHYWEPRCFDTPIGWALRSLFDALDGINQLTDQLDNVSAASPSSMSCRTGLRRLRQRQRPSCWTRC